MNRYCQQCNILVSAQIAWIGRCPKCGEILKTTKETNMSSSANAKDTSKQLSKTVRKNFQRNTSQKDTNVRLKTKDTQKTNILQNNEYNILTSIAYQKISSWVKLLTMNDIMCRLRNAIAKSKNDLHKAKNNESMHKTLNRNYVALSKARQLIKKDSHHGLYELRPINILKFLRGKNVFSQYIYQIFDYDPNWTKEKYNIIKQKYIEKHKHVPHRFSNISTSSSIVDSNVLSDSSPKFLKTENSRNVNSNIVKNTEYEDDFKGPITPWV